MTKSAMEDVMTTREVATRFNELAKQEKWFEIQDELFSDDVKALTLQILLISGMRKVKLMFAKKERSL